MKTYSQQIKILEKELGDRMQALVAHEPYKDLNFASRELYKMIKGRIHTLECRISFIERLQSESIERENAVVEYVESDCSEYDSHLDTGMDSSIDINEFNLSENK